MRAVLLAILMASAPGAASLALAQQPPVSGAVKRPVTPLGSDEFWLQVASRQTLTDSIAVAEEYAPDFPKTSVLQSQNGWYAIIVDVVKDGAVKETLQRLKETGLIPDDSYATPGKSYLWIAWPAIDPHAPVTGVN